MAYFSIPQFGLCYYYEQVMIMDYVDKLTSLREDHDLKQADIANILGITQTAVSKYELRQRRYQVQDIIALCKYYGISSDYLLDLPLGLDDPRNNKE